MAFVMRAKRREDGGYDFSFGKGQKKMSAVCTQDAHKLWCISDGFGSGTVLPSKKLGDVKDSWGKRAEASYGGQIPSQTETGSPENPPIPGPPRLPGPPRIGP